MRDSRSSFPDGFGKIKMNKGVVYAVLVVVVCSWLRKSPESELGVDD